MILTYAGRTRLSAQAIAEEDEDIVLNRGSRGDANWGRYRADTELNPDISNATNKRRMRELFQEHGVPMPGLYSPRIAMTLIDQDQPMNKGRVLVGRPDHHSKGRGYWLCRNAQDVQKALRGTRRKKAATHFMEYIDADREYRVHIFKGKSIRISEKCFDTEERKGGYVTVRPEHDVRRVRKAAKQAMEALGLDFGAVDILAKGEDNEEVFVLEVNAAPGLGGSMPRLYAQVFKQWERGEL